MEFLPKQVKPKRSISRPPDRSISHPGQAMATEPGGAKGVPGVVVSSGFGNGTAVPDTRPRATGTVQASGFASADVPAPPTVQSRPAETAANVLPAEIISKPTPVYTQEARNLRIEGEVLLEVVLEASGRLRVAARGPRIGSRSRR